MTTLEHLVELLDALCRSKKKEYILIVKPNLGAESDLIAQSNMIPQRQLKLLKELTRRMQK